MQHLTQIVPQLWSLALDESVNLVAAIVILCAGWTLANAAARWLRRVLSSVDHIDPTLKPLVASLLRYAVIGFTLMAVLERFGVRTTSVIALLGATGIAIGLALQGTLSNVASGVMLLLLRCFRVGDEITAGNYTGVVKEIGLFRTSLVTGDGLYVSIPNSSLFSDAIVNNTREPTRQVSFKISIDHTQNIERAQALALDAINANNRILKSPAPAASVAELGDYEVTLGIAAWTLTADYGRAGPELKKAVREKFREAGIRPPQRLVSVGGNPSPATKAAAAAAAEQPSRKSA